MPRRGRLHIPGGCYHIIGRGLERRYIFDADEDKENFLSRLGENLVRCQVQCLAWAMMSNHYHLFVRVSDKPLSSLMAPLLGGYAGYYNRRHRRSGYVFQNRFKSILCDADNYLMELVRYIHLNPVRAGMIDSLQELEQYRWTGHAGVFGRHRRDWHSVDEMLGFFGRSRSLARKRYRDFMAQKQHSGSGSNLSGGGLVRSSGGWEVLSRLRREHSCRIGDERILGSGDFVEQALHIDELAIDSKSNLERAGWTLEKLVNAVCRTYGISAQNLLKKTRHVDSSLAKSLICYWGTDLLGLTAKEIAARLGVSHQAVSYRAKIGRQHCESNGLDFEEMMR